MKLLLKRLASRYPTALPVGMTEFNTWADSVIELSGKFADEDSLKYVLSTMIIHLKPDQAFVPKYHFVKCLRKGAANQVASAVFTDIKTRQAEAQAKVALEASQPKAEDTVPTAVSSDVETKKD